MLFLRTLTFLFVNFVQEFSILVYYCVGVDEEFIKAAKQLFRDICVTRPASKDFLTGKYIMRKFKVLESWHS